MADASPNTSVPGGQNAGAGGLGMSSLQNSGGVGFGAAINSPQSQNPMNQSVPQTQTPSFTQPPSPPAPQASPPAPATPMTNVSDGFESQFASPQVNQFPTTSSMRIPEPIHTEYASTQPQDQFNAVPTSTQSPVSQAQPTGMDVFIQPTVQQQGPQGMAPAAIDTQMDPPTIQQAALSDTEKDELFGREKLSSIQKIIIIIIVLVALGLILGAGIWIYTKVNSDGFVPKEENQKVEPTTTNADSDGDSLIDQKEAELGTDPNNTDSDGDGYLDGEEVENGFDPLGP